MLKLQYTFAGGAATNTMPSRDIAALGQDAFTSSSWPVRESAAACERAEITKG